MTNHNTDHSRSKCSIVCFWNKFSGDIFPWNKAYQQKRHDYNDLHYTLLRGILFSVFKVLQCHQFHKLCYTSFRFLKNWSLMSSISQILNCKYCWNWSKKGKCIAFLISKTVNFFSCLRRFWLKVIFLFHATSRSFRRLVLFCWRHNRN